MRTGSARRMVGGGEGGGSAGRQLGRGYYVLGQKLPLAANRPEQGALQLKETSTGRGASRKPSLGSRRHKAVRPACGEGGGACICPSEEGCHLPPDLTATSGIRTRDPNTGPQVSKAEPILPQAQNSCHLHVSHALVTRLSAILVGGGGGGQPKPQCQDLWKALDSSLLQHPHLAHSSKGQPGARLWTGSN